MKLPSSTEKQTAPSHPAKFTKALWSTLVEQMAGGKVVCDPFAGIGTIHRLAELAGVPESVGVELEAEWAMQAIELGWADNDCRRVVVGDSRQLTDLVGVSSVDMIVTSPVYGNRMSDSFNATDGSVRNTYHHQLGRRPTEGSAAVLHFGKDGSYEDLHSEVWAECHRVLRNGGRMVVNVSDFLRTVPLRKEGRNRPYEEVVTVDSEKGRARVRLQVVQFHLDALQSCSFQLTDHILVDTPRQRQGQNGHVRVDSESVLVR